MLDERYQESKGHNILNKLLVFALKLISYLPFLILYGVSDILYFILKNIAGYRKKVIVENLRNSFPEKSKLEIKKITARYYHFFCDMAIEIVKSHSMSSKQFDKRIIFKNVC